jgi:NCS1 family nucleobase:cation symporter-1
MILIIVPMLPALANKVTPTNVHISTALSHLFMINWLYGFVASCVLYYVLNLVFPARRTLIPSVIHGDIEVVQGVLSSKESTDGDIGHAEKGLKTDEAKEVGETGNREAEKSL